MLGTRGAAALARVSDRPRRSPGPPSGRVGPLPAHYGVQRQAQENGSGRDTVDQVTAVLMRPPPRPASDTADFSARRGFRHSPATAIGPMARSVPRPSHAGDRKSVV